MGGNFTKELNKVFGEGSAASQGGMAAGTSPEDWNQQPKGQGRPGQETAGTGPPPPTKPPPIPKYVQPAMYAPKQSQLQKSTFNPSSTSHDYLSRYSVSKHF